MANPKPQNYRNHVRVVPMFQVILLIFAINLGWTIYRLAKVGIRFRTVLAVLMALAFPILAVLARHFALVVQDRVIRLEMRLRMAELLPPELRARLSEFTVEQLVSLRFASDLELPDLARKVLEEKINDRKIIKQLIKDWQADHLRA